MRVVVVGAGVLGASATFHLAGAGVEVVLVDRADQGQATAAGAGIVAPWGTRIEEPAIYALLDAGARFYRTLVPTLAEEGERELGYAEVGALFVPDEEAELDAAEQRVRARAEGSPEAGTITRLSPREARVLFPPLRPDLAGLHVSGGARVNGRLLAAALRRAAVRRGARELAGDAVLLPCGGHVAGVRVGEEMVEADVVVVAAGAWAPTLLAPMGVQLPVEPQRGQIAHLRLPGTDTARWPTLQPLRSHYLLAFDDSRVVVGATREHGSGFDHRLTAGGVAEVLNAGLHSAPGLATWTLEEVRIGFRPMAADGRPLLGPVRGVDGLFVGNGLGPSGLTMGPLAGALLADAVLNRPTALSLDPYDPLR